MRIGLASLALLALTSTAMAEPLDFRPMTEDSSEYDIVRSIVPDGAASTAFVDLNGDEQAEPIVRIGDDCDNAPCRTLVFAQVSSDWRLVLDKTMSSVELGEPGIARMKSIYGDGLVWSWRTTSYVADVPASGSVVTLALVPSDYVQPLLEQFGAGAELLFEGNRNATLTYGSVTPGEGLGEMILVKLEGAGACGRVFGCPVRLLTIEDGAYVPVLEGFSSGDVVLSNVIREGHRDIITTLPAGGFAIYGWSGSVYGQVDAYQRN